MSSQKDTRLILGKVVSNIMQKKNMRMYKGEFEEDTLLAPVQTVACSGSRFLSPGVGGWGAINSSVPLSCTGLSAGGAVMYGRAVSPLPTIASPFVTSLPRPHGG